MCPVTSSFEARDLEKGLQPDRLLPSLGHFPDPYGYLGCNPAPLQKSLYYGDASVEETCWCRYDYVDDYNQLRSVDLCNELREKTTSELKHELQQLESHASTSHNSRTLLTIADLLPNAVNFIWLDEVFTNSSSRANVEKFIAMNPEFTFVLWTSVPRSFLQRIRSYGGKTTLSTLESRVWDMATWCSENKILLVNVDEVFSPTTMELHELFMLTRMRNHFASASDILRCSIVYRFGGMYSDLDQSCEKPLVSLSQHAVKDSAHYFGIMAETKKVNHSVLIATPRHPLLKVFIDHIKERYQQLRTQVLWDATKEMFDGTYQHDSNAFFYETLFTTGPNAIATAIIRWLWSGPVNLDWDCVARHDRATVEAEAILYIQMLYNGLGISDNQDKNERAKKFVLGALMVDDTVDVRGTGGWANRRLIPVDTRENARRVVTCILCDLKRRPNILDLSVYDWDYSGLKLVVDCLLQKFSPNLKSVKQIWLRKDIAQLDRVEIYLLHTLEAKGWSDVTNNYTSGANPTHIQGRVGFR